jgi:hypothetical protein
VYAGDARATVKTVRRGGLGPADMHVVDSCDVCPLKVPLDGGIVVGLDRDDEN